MTQKTVTPPMTDEADIGPTVSERANDFAMKALTRMRDEDVPPTPENFSVWYSYYAHRIPDLNRAIDLIAGNGLRFDMRRCRELHDKYISQKKMQEAVNSVSNGIDRILNTLQEMISDADASTTRYGGVLNEAKRAINPGTPLDILKPLIEQVASETRRMAAENSKLQSELAESSTQMQQLRNNLDSIRTETRTDTLTGIPNRRALDEGLAEAAAMAIEEDRALSLLMIDIDHFKKFNDTHGHQTGDMVLKLIARTLRANVRETDLAARFGGEEFSVVLPDTTLEGAILVAEKLRRMTADKKLVNRRNGIDLGQVTVSIGASEYSPKEPLRDLIERADAALYDAKRAGRNRVVARDSEGSIVEFD